MKEKKTFSVLFMAQAAMIAAIYGSLFHGNESSVRDLPLVKQN